MNVARPIRPAEEAQPPAGEVEGEISGLVRREVASYRRQADCNEASLADEAHAIIERVSLTSVSEIDNLVAQLQSLREFLQQESERLECEMAEYLHLASTAAKSTKLISESIAAHKMLPPR